MNMLMLDFIVPRAGPPPRFVRASHYSYRYTKIGSEEAMSGHWWIRDYIGQYMQPLSLESIDPLYTYFGWDQELEK